jgi:hypothetical protein
MQEWVSWAYYHSTTETDQCNNYQNVPVSKTKMPQGSNYQCSKRKKLCKIQTDV